MKNQNVGNRQRGFTIIELLLVIVISGILAAITLPKFVNFQTEARIASLGAARGALAATASLARAKFLVSAPPPTTIDFEGSVVTLTASTYPRADLVFIAAAGISSTDYTIIGGTGAVVAPTTTAPGASATEVVLVPRSVANSARALTCFVRYTESTSATNAPLIAMTSTGC